MTITVQSRIKQAISAIAPVLSIQFAWALLVPLPTISAQSSPPLVVTNGVVFTATGADPIRDGTVVILGNRIESVGPQSDVDIPAGARVIDAEGGLVIPGIINAHVHHAGPAEERKRFLAEGVTTVCDVGSSWEEVAGFRQSEHQGEPVARGFFAGLFITPPGGYPDGRWNTAGLNLEVSGIADIRRGVRALADSGAHFIKVALDPGWDEENPIPFFNPEEARAVVAAAEAHGLRVRSHSIRNGSFPLVVDAGVQIVEHMPFPDGWPPVEIIEELMESGDPLDYFFNAWHPRYDPLLTSMAEAGLVMVPTASTLLGDMFEKENPTPRDLFLVMAALDIVRRFREKGGVIALGNDYNGRSVRERFPAAEIRALLAAGLTPAEVLEAGTRFAAWTCGQEETLGTLEPGKLADLLILGGDFFDDPSVINSIQWVILNGTVVRRGR